MNQHTSAIESNPRKISHLPAAPLYLGFALTGIGVALPGALLPVLLKRWSLEDAQGGMLFLLAWLGSASGALLVRGSLRTVLVSGSLAIAAGAFGLATAASPHIANVCVALFGLGLGSTMTAVSLIRQQQAHGASREMVRLNLVWAVGACLCPTLTIHALASARIAPLLFSLAFAFCLLALWALLNPALSLSTAASNTERPSTFFHTTPWRLILMAFLITGVEASVSGWLATYIHRGEHRLAKTIAAPTCLWAGLLLSRLFWSLRAPPGTASSVRIVRVSLVLMLGATILLIADVRPLATLMAALALGFAIGPLYPLLLAWALNFHRGGPIFFIAGVGSACLPWLTGLVSALHGGLRVGLCVPIAASAIMLVLSLTPGIAAWANHSAEGTALIL